MVNEIEKSAMLAAAYNEQMGEQEAEAAVAALAVVAATATTIGFETLSRVFLDYAMYVIPETEYVEFLGNVVNDNGILEE